ncbi:MAG: hypothetical protein IT460_15385 [Planctomycetes bacterium]|nr:hypothetical protein [Planctomycetota bacterium]
MSADPTHAARPRSRKGAHFALLFGAAWGALVLVVHAVLRSGAGLRGGFPTGPALQGAAAGFAFALFYEVLHVTGTVSMKGHRDDPTPEERQSFGIALAIFGLGLLGWALYFLFAWPGVRLARATGLYAP